MVLKELLNLGYHPCCETSDRRHKLSPHGLISPRPHFSCLFRMKITMTLSPFLGLRQVFLAGTRVSSQKKGLISGKPVVDVVITEGSVSKAVGIASEWGQLCFLC